MYNFKYLSAEDIPWSSLEHCYDHTVYKSHSWALFLKDYYSVDPFVIEISEKDKCIGYFYGQRIKKFGIKIVASPFEGWSTSYQGISMLYEISVNKRIDIYQELISFLFDKKYCCFFQVSDWQLEVAYLLHRNIPCTLNKGYILDLTADEEVLYKNMSYSSAKYSINKAIKQGVKVYKPTNIKDFSHNYYLQLCDVFAKQGMKPTHNESQVISMLEHLAINDNFVSFEAFDSSGNSLATAFFIHDHDFAFYVGGASFQSAQKLCPNEPVMYQAILELKRKGAKYLEFGGGRRYKEKYGPLPYIKSQIIVAKYPILLQMKYVAKFLFYNIRSLLSLLKQHK